MVGGTYAYQTVLKYLNQINHTLETLNEEEISNLEIFKKIAVEKGFDPDEVISTGALREFVPSSMKADIFNCPPPDARPFDENLRSSTDEIPPEFHHQNFENLLEKKGFFQFFFELFKKNK